MDQEPAFPEPIEPAVKEEETFTFKATHFYAVLVVLAFAVGILVGYLAWGRTPVVQPVALESTDGQAAALPTVVVPTTDPVVQKQKLMAAIMAKARHIQGDANAPVTMVEFGDFQCPFCGKYASETSPQIEDQYVKTGKVRFVFMNFAFLGSESTWAAEAAECAADQNKYWEFHDKLYSSQNGENKGAFTKDNLKKFAQDLGLDTATFDTCLDTDKYASLIESDNQTASSLGIQSTPTFVINGSGVEGAQPFDYFKQIIDQSLGEPTPTAQP